MRSVIILIAIMSLFVAFASNNIMASEVHYWGPEYGNYNVAQVERNVDIANMTEVQIKEKVLKSENVYNIVKGLKGKEVANDWRAELVKGNYIITSCLPEYLVGSGYGDGCVMKGQVILSEKLKKYLTVVRVVLYKNNKKIVIDIPIYDMIFGYKTASCFNPCIDEEVVEPPPTTTPVPTPPPTATPVPPPTPTEPPAPPTAPTEPPPVTYQYQMSKVYGSNTGQSSSKISTQTFDVFTIVKTWTSNEPECTPTEKPDPEPTPPPPDPTCPPDQTPPPAPTLPPAPNPTCPPTPPPQITTPENPSQPITPPDAELVPIGGGNTSSTGTPPVPTDLTAQPVEVVAPPPDNNDLVN